MADRVVDLPGVPIDLSGASVVAAVFERRDLILKVAGVKIPGSRARTAILRFEVLEEFDAIRDFLTARIGRSKLEVPGRARPIPVQLYGPDPLELPATLKTLVHRRGPGPAQHFEFALDERRFRRRRKAFVIACKRLVITDRSGDPIAGDPSPRATAKRWTPRQFRSVAARFAEALERGDYDAAHGLLDAPLRSRRSPERLRSEFESWVRLAPEDLVRRTFRRAYAIRLVDERDSWESLPEGLDPDRYRARAWISFLGRFSCVLDLVDRDGELRIGAYEIERDWELD